MSTLVSVIITVYNKYNYLKKCIKSILAQTLDDIEIIIIDDQSCDTSFEIAEHFAEEDNRVHVYRNDRNLGVYATRYEGIRYCTGQYITFADADDWFNPDLLRRMYDAIEETGADLAQARICRRMNGIAVRYHETFDKTMAGRRIDGEDFRTLATYIGMDSYIQPPCWAKLYRSDILRQIRPIEFHQFWGDDQIFNIQYLREIKSMVFVDYIGYNYRWGGQTSSRYKFSAIRDYKNVYQIKRMFGLDEECLDSELLSLLHYYVRSLMTEVGFTRQATEMTMEEELRDPLWQRLLPGVTARELVAEQVEHVQRNPLKYLAKRVLR